MSQRKQKMEDKEVQRVLTLDRKIREEGEKVPGLRAFLEPIKDGTRELLSVDIIPEKRIAAYLVKEVKDGWYTEGDERYVVKGNQYVCVRYDHHFFWNNHYSIVGIYRDGKVDEKKKILYFDRELFEGISLKKEIYEESMDFEEVKIIELTETEIKVKASSCNNKDYTIFKWYIPDLILHGGRYHGGR